MKTKIPQRKTERRHAHRQPFSFYMRVLDDDTDETIGYLLEVGASGFRLETNGPLPLQKEYRLRMELTPDISDRLFIFIMGRTKWLKPDVYMPDLYHVGFEITNVSPHDHEIYQRLLEKYGR